MTALSLALHAHSLLVYSHCFLYAVMLRRPSGAVEVWVYRSTKVKNRHTLYRPVLDIVGDAQPVYREVMEDESMVFGEGEMLMYLLPRYGAHKPLEAA